MNDGAFFVALCPVQTMDQYLELHENGTFPDDMQDANLSVVEKVISFLLSKRE